MSNLQQFDGLRADIIQYVEPCMTITVKDQEQQVVAYAAGKEVKRFQKLIEEKRKELVGPLNEQVKKINEYAKKINEPLDKAEVHIKKELVAFERELEKIRIEEMKKAQAEKERLEKIAAEEAAAKAEEAEMAAMIMGDDDSERAAVMVQVEAERKTEEIEKAHADNVRNISALSVKGTTRRWTFEITDEAQVPREFMVIDEKKIREAIRGECREIPGVRIFQETSVALR